MKFKLTKYQDALRTAWTGVSRKDAQWFCNVTDPTPFLSGKLSQPAKRMAEIGFEAFKAETFSKAEAIKASVASVRIESADEYELYGNSYK